MEQLFGYEQVAKWIVNIRLTFVLFALVSGSVVFAGHRGFLFCWRYRGTPEEGGIGPGVDAVGDVFEVLWGGCG